MGKVIADTLGFEAMSEWDDISVHSGHSGSGFANVDLTLKYVLWQNPKSEFQIALTPTVSFPTNSHIGDEDMPANAGIGVSWGGRLSVLKNAGWVRYFRAVEFQGDLGYSRPLGDPPGDDIYFDPMIDYSFPYL